MELGLNYFIIAGLLIVACVFLERWQPPLKKQYIALILFVLGGGLSYYTLHNLAYGILIAGLVYYKEELVQEVAKVKDSFTSIRKEIKDEE